MEIYEEMNENYKLDTGIEILPIISDILGEISDAVSAYVDIVAMEDGSAKLSVNAPEHAAIIQGAMFIGAISWAGRRGALGEDGAVDEIYRAARELSEGGMERAGIVTMFSGIGAKIMMTVLSKLGATDQGWETAGFAISIAGAYAALELKKAIARR